MADTTFKDPALLTTVAVRLQAIYSTAPGHGRDPALDQILNAGGTQADIPRIALTLLGGWINFRYNADPFRAAVMLRGSWVKTISIVAEPLRIAIRWKLGASFIGGPGWTSAPAKGNWVKWSKIGSLDFTIDKGNLAGERPMDWPGTVWGLKWLGDKIAVYGQNGITLLTPAGNAFGMQTLSQVGLRGKLALADIGGVHYALDRNSHLFTVVPGQGVKDLDYSEYLISLGAGAVLSYDPFDQLLYLCDGTSGFIYDPVAGSLGVGPINITGMDYRGGTRYIAAQAAVTMPLFEITTDTYDMGSRHAKSIQSIEAGLDTTVAVEVSVDYRHSKSAAFLSTAWYPLDTRGVRYIQCYGYEFRFHLRALSAGWFRLDYLRANGVVHDH